MQATIPRMMHKVLFYAYLNNFNILSQNRKGLAENIYFMRVLAKYPDFARAMISGQNFKRTHIIVVFSH